MFEEKVAKFLKNTFVTFKQLFVFTFFIKVICRLSFISLLFEMVDKNTLSNDILLKPNYKRKLPPH